MISITSEGSFQNTENFLKRMSTLDIRNILHRYGQLGVDVLSASTPMDSGLTAQSWYYEVRKDRNRWIIDWKNSNVEGGVPIAILIQYGHGTRNGGLVQGRDYINPAIRPIFDQIADEAWREVTRK